MINELATNADGCMVALYDSSAVSSAYTSPNSTVIFMSGNQFYFVSSNLGYDWSGQQQGPWSTGTRAFASMVADLENNIYFLGGGTVGDAWYSYDKGSSWYALTIASAASLNGAVYGGTSVGSCLGLRYVASSSSSSSSSSYTKQLVLYGGTITLSSGTVTTLQANVSSAVLDFPPNLNAVKLTAAVSTQNTLSAGTYADYVFAVPLYLSNSTDIVLVAHALASVSPNGDVDIYCTQQSGFAGNTAGRSYQWSSTLVGGDALTLNLVSSPPIVAGDLLYCSAYTKSSSATSATYVLTLSYYQRYLLVPAAATVSGSLAAEQVIGADYTITSAVASSY